MKDLDINKLNKMCKNIKIGELTQEHIDILGIDLKPQNIHLWGSRINEHCEKHKIEYASPDNYNQAISKIPLIISEPDYIGVRNDSNIQYVKKLNESSMIGIKVLKGNKGGLIFRTIFPVTEDKIKETIYIVSFIVN